jgi:DNA repair exonuclease SbcCD ATPase subunit
MIPQRIYLKGFMCYRDEGEVCFDEASLWMLSGPNGSGKSTLFDAITYALFGRHRLGEHNARELINKHCDGFEVEFEFMLEGQLYQARRTLTRSGRPTRALRQWIASAEADGVGNWQVVPDTDSPKGFEAWVREHVGLEYETFVSSVLLLQGGAEKLIRSDPSERRKVLAGILGLKRFEDLHKRVKEAFKHLEGQEEQLKHQLVGLPKVRKGELKKAVQEVKAAQAERDKAQKQIERLERLRGQAEQWESLQKDLADLQRQVKEADKLLTRADSIEHDGKRLQEYNAVLLHLETVIEDRRKLAESLEMVRRVDEERQLLEPQADKLDRLIETAKGDLERLREEIDSEGARKEDLVAQQTSLSEARASLEKLSLAREKLRQAEGRGAKATREAAEAAKQLKQCEEELKSLAAKHKAAATVRGEADKTVAAKEARLSQVQARFGEFNNLKGAKKCRLCGQPLDAEHVHKEKERLEAELEEKEKECAEARAQRNRLAEEEHRLSEEREEAEEQRNAWRQSLASARDTSKDAQENCQAHAADCLHAYRELDPLYRHRVSKAPPADWLATSYPAAEDLSALRCDQEQRKGEMTRLAKSYADHQKEESRRQKEIEGQEKEHKKLRDRLAKIDQGVAAQKAHQKGYREAISRARAALQPSWRPCADSDTLPDDLKKWKAERDKLQRQDAEGQMKRLQEARADRDNLIAQIERANRQVAKVPEEARRDPATIDQRLQEAKELFEECDRKLTTAREQKQELMKHRKDREKLDKDYRKLNERVELHRQLARQLGPEGLQLYLVREAEKGIVGYANNILDHLSGGQLYLQRRSDNDMEGAAQKALVLEVLDRAVAGEEPLDVRLLSGSQLFRVAVSLALGIGQYAGRLHRRIQSVAIDEGFGCLDKNNRQVMIRELDNLQRMVRRILIVSHQEEFANAFRNGNGYHFELVDGTTRVTPFHD